MKARHDVDGVRPETILLVPFVIILFGMLVYFLVELLPTVRVLPG
jgi:hypothetical protein